MKVLLILLLPFFTLANGVVRDTIPTDSTMVSNETLINNAVKIVNLEKKVDDLTKVVYKQDTIIVKQDIALRRDSLQISLLKMQNEGYQEIVKLTLPISKKNWYEQNWFYYTLGAATMYVSAKMLSLIK